MIKVTTAMEGGETWRTPSFYVECDKEISGSEAIRAVQQHLTPGLRAARASSTAGPSQAGSQLWLVETEEWLP